MSLSINTNVASLQMQRSLFQQQTSEATAMQRLSTGKRVNSAKDDAAALFTIEKQTMDIRASSQIDKGLSDGISYAQVAEGALSEIQKMLQRAKEIAVQAANATVEDRTGLEKEWDQLKAEIDRITESTEAFGFSPLKNEFIPFPDNIPTITDETTAFINTTFIPGVTQGLRSEFIGEPFINFPEARPYRFTGNVAVKTIPEGYSNIDIMTRVSNSNATINENAHGMAVFDRFGKQLTGQPLSHDMWTVNGVNSGNIKDLVFKEEYGFYSNAAYDSSNLNSGGIIGVGTSASTRASSVEEGINIRYGRSFGNSNPSGPDQVNETITIDEAKKDLILVFMGDDRNPIPEFVLDVIATPGSSNNNGVETLFKVLTDIRPTSSDSFVTINKTAVDTTTLGINSLDMTTQSNAQTAIDSLESAMDTISGHRTYYGAIVNRMETTKSTTNSHRFNIESSKSRIEDADYAQETAALTRSQILKQAAMGMVSLARTSQQSVMALLSSLPKAA